MCKRCAELEKQNAALRMEIVALQGPERCSRDALQHGYFFYGEVNHDWFTKSGSGSTEGELQKLIANFNRRAA